VEAVREVGGRELLAPAVQLAAAAGRDQSIQGESELGAISASTLNP